MHAEPSAHRSAFAHLAANLAMGSLVMALLGMLDPRVSLREALPGWLCVAAAGLTAASLGNAIRELPALPLHLGVFRRSLSSLLLGSSLLAVPWHSQGLPVFSWAAAMGFGTRWLLYGLESLDLRAAELGREALPSLATRLRRIVTWVTGGAIPLLVISGLPGSPLLFLSFLLTLFAQWTVAGEHSHAAAASSRAHESRILG